ncbi:MAG: UPF0149 family protein [Rhodocyclaceae bacterium]|nr:UPF0149 family protein [Rhodocyclaceae bacterium]MCA3103220.1 UPF0149 family protein [Rhodocyclaceae bacterium]MCA3118518.1 UPF0149 family protein [Rhodocyclaceae bacterium]MCA3125075.1 UPF0149 family protein [Rhodocyclaceae bacterium]
MTMPPTPHGFSPLSDEEVDELAAFLMEDRDGSEAMMFDTMDGYMHAVAIGPTTLKPQQWLPPIWGLAQDQGMVPAAQSLEQINRILELVMRHFNSIIAGLEDERPDIYPHWCVMVFDGQEFDDAEGWAWGFVQGVDLCRADWQPLLETDQGQAWYRPIGLLGEDDFGPEQDTLTRTPAQRAELALQIPEAVLRMHAHWLPLRRAIHERAVARTLQTKVGRNEPCPCGSGKKFKKCCGAPADLH